MEPSSLLSSGDEPTDTMTQFLSQQAAALMRLSLKFNSLSSRIEESPALHFVGCFLMFQIEITFHQIQMFEKIREHHAAIVRLTSINSLCALFRVKATYHPSRFNLIPSKSLDPGVPDRKSLGGIMKELSLIIPQQMDTLQDVTKFMKKWRNKQHQEVTRLSEIYTWWKDNSASLAEQPETANQAVSKPPSRIIEVGESSKTKEVYTMGPLWGKNLGIRTKGMIMRETAAILFSKTSSHSFISRSSTITRRLTRWEMNVVVKRHKGKALKGKEIARFCQLTIQGHVYTANLIVLPFIGCDVVLGRDWLDTCEYFVFEENCCKFKSAGVETVVLDTAW